MFEKAQQRIKEVDLSSFEQEILGNEDPVLLAISAQWCEPCRALTPLLDRLAMESGTRLKILTIDADQGREALLPFNIEGVPTCLLFLKGKLQSRLAGIQPFKVLKQWVESHLN